MPRVTARKPPERQPQAAYGTVTLQRLNSITRAGGMKAAVTAKKWAQEIAITLN